MKISEYISRYALYWMMFLFILIVSCVDLYLIVKYQDDMAYNEKNIVGTWLINLNKGSVAAFCAVKMFGTCLCLAILKKIWIHNKKWGWAIGCGLCLAQLALLWFLFW